MGERRFSGSGKILKKSSVLTTLYKRKIPVFLGLTLFFLGGGVGRDKHIPYEYDTYLLIAIASYYHSSQFTENLLLKNVF